MELVDQQQYIFDYWNNVISAYERIKKIEKRGSSQKYEIKVIRNPPEIIELIDTQMNHILNVV
jgi:hypothetical protein